jgi:hypothetical protein
MTKRYVVVGVCLAMALGLFLAGARAEYRTAGGTDSGTGTAGTSDIAARLDKLEAKVSMVQAFAEKSDHEIQAKLAMVLENQERILKQLDIVKVRSTR